MKIEVYWDDLNEEKQKELLNLLGGNMNWDIFPLAAIDVDEIEEEEE